MTYNHTEYMRGWRERNREKVRNSKKKWMLNNPEKTKEMWKRKRLKHNYGSVERYNEAMQKYEGECAFACGKQAKLVHHFDGKSYRNSLKEQPDNSLKNLLPLCGSCHVWLHKPALRR